MNRCHNGEPNALLAVYVVVRRGAAFRWARDVTASEDEVLSGRLQPPPSSVKSKFKPYASA